MKKNRTFKILRRRLITLAESYADGWVRRSLSKDVYLISGYELFAIVDGEDTWILTADGRARKSSPAGDIIRLKPEDVEHQFTRIISEYIPRLK